MSNQYADTAGALAPEDIPAFKTSTFWTSPSTYLTLVTYLLPLLNIAFGRDVSALAEAVANMAPIVATGILLVMRNIAQGRVTQANLELSKLKLASGSYVPRDGRKEERLDDLERRMCALEDWWAESTRVVDSETTTDLPVYPEAPGGSLRV